MSSNYSPGRSPGSNRLQQLGFGGGFGGVSRLRSSSMKKPPEPLRRAVADCLSSSSTAAAPTLLHPGSPSGVVFEASRTLRDYLATPGTTDMAYCVIIEHTIAERERSPAVVARCVALLKRYLLRYKPGEETLLQIDRFCLNTIAECDINPNRRVSPWSRSLTQQSGASTVSANASPSLPVSSFAFWSTAAFAGATPASRQSLPTLSSLLSRSFNSQISPANVVESSENKDSTTLSVSNLSNIEEVDGMEDLEYIASDVLKWRWLEEHQSSSMSTESDRAITLQEMSTHTFVEVGAAALLVGDMEAKMKGQPWKYFGTRDMPYLDQLLQPSSVTTVTNSASALSHLRAITASKRTKAGPRQIWHVLLSQITVLLYFWKEDSPVNTFRPRARPTFSISSLQVLNKRSNSCPKILYMLCMATSEQQPLRLNPAEVCEVIAAVCSETSSPNANSMTVSSRLSNNRGKPLIDVAVSVLIKLVIDMYVLGSGTAAPLTLSMLQVLKCLVLQEQACRVRAFDLVLNLGVHAHLLEPMMTDDTSTIEDEYSEDSFFENEDQLMSQGKRKTDSIKKSSSSAIDNFESWILNILYEILLLLVQIEEKEESVWASALSCLLYFVCDRGKIWRNRLNGLDIRVIKALLETCRKNSWAEVVHCKLICLLTNMLYDVPDGPAKGGSSTPSFLVDQLDLIGGIEFIFLEYALANSREERRNLYVVLFDYVLYQINNTCIAAGVSEYADDEIQPVASLLGLADAPEAFYISVKLGVEGIGGLLRRSIAVALSRYPNSERLNMLLENVAEKFDIIISSFTHLDKEFSHLQQITKTFKFMESFEDVRNGVFMKVKLSWATLHSLLHSERIAYRQNGHIWLGDLLIAEISEERGASVWSNIKNLQRKIAHAGCHDSSVASDVPLSIWLMCGLLKSKNNLIRWGFLNILERLLMRCKFLLDEKEQHPMSDVANEHEDSRLEKANAVIDIMSSALSLVAQINETDRINILKMCDILFSQLCLKVFPAAAKAFGDGMHQSKVLGSVDENKKNDAAERLSQKESGRWDEFLKETEIRSGYNMNRPIFETASMAAQLLRGQAVQRIILHWVSPVGSKGRGNLPGATSDIRATLLLLLIGKCTADPAAFQEVGGEEFFRELLDDTDSRVAYYSSAFLLKARMLTNFPSSNYYF
ncbi:hypothetical protein Patl1_06308 [Pistacia atlantica]|uniref:Uncharacterized protein n=1 Tax=Pistacia atlantica TaxID=434234 RepID=A0ACC1BVB8_9ROSI|nr:hypothetical protein Patl1_06308 [Pistacia atlantica]